MSTPTRASLLAENAALWDVIRDLRAERYAHTAPPIPGLTWWCRGGDLVWRRYVEGGREDAAALVLTVGDGWRGWGTCMLYAGNRVIEHRCPACRAEARLETLQEVADATFRGGAAGGGR